MAAPTGELWTAVMTGDEFNVRYRIFKQITREGVQTFGAVGDQNRRCLIHVFPAEEGEASLDPADLAGAPDQVVLEVLRVEGRDVVVTDEIPGFTTFETWVEGLRPPPEDPVAVGEYTKLFRPADVEPPAREPRLDPFASGPPESSVSRERPVAEEQEAGPTVAPDAALDVPAAGESGAGEYTRLFSTGQDRDPEPVAPEPRMPAPADTAGPQPFVASEPTGSPSAEHPGSSMGPGDRSPPAQPASSDLPPPEATETSRGPWPAGYGDTGSSPPSLPPGIPAEPTPRKPEAEGRVSTPGAFRVPPRPDSRFGDTRHPIPGGADGAGAPSGLDSVLPPPAPPPRQGMAGSVGPVLPDRAPGPYTEEMRSPQPFRPSEGGRAGQSSDALAHPRPSPLDRLKGPEAPPGPPPAKAPLAGLSSPGPTPNPIEADTLLPRPGAPVGPSPYTQLIKGGGGPEPPRVPAPPPPASAPAPPSSSPQVAPARAPAGSSNIALWIFFGIAVAALTVFLLVAFWPSAS